MSSTDHRGTSSAETTRRINDVYGEATVKESTDDPEAPAPLVTSLKTRRWAAPHALKNRSKYALRPHDAVELGNHFVWELAPGATSVGVPTDRALLHHYRIACEYGGTQCLTVPSTVDRTAHRWADELIQRVSSEKEQIAKSCPA